MNLIWAATELSRQKGCPEEQARACIIEGCELGILESYAGLVVRTVDGVFEEACNGVLGPKQWKVSTFDWQSEILSRDRSKGALRSRYKALNEIEFIRADHVQLLHHDYGYEELSQYYDIQNSFAAFTEKDISKPSPIGRPKGTNYSVKDIPIFVSMKDLRDQGRVTSITEAAKHFAVKAHGAGTLQSKITRLVKGYKAHYSEN